MKTTKKTIVYLLAAQEPCTLAQIMEECSRNDKTPELAVLIAIAEMVRTGTICGDSQDGWVLSDDAVGEGTWTHNGTWAKGR